MSQQVRSRLEQRARDFYMVIDDVSLTDIAFSPVFTGLHIQLSLAVFASVSTSPFIFGQNTLSCLLSPAPWHASCGLATCHTWMRVHADYTRTYGCKCIHPYRVRGGKASGATGGTVCNATRAIHVLSDATSLRSCRRALIAV